MGLFGGVLYTLELENLTFNNANGDYDIFEIEPVANRPVVVHGFEIYVITELGEAEEEWLRLKVIRGHTTGAGGLANTPRLVNTSGPAAAFAAEERASTVASGGTPIDIWSGGMNIRAGIRLFPLAPWLVTAADSRVVLRLMAAVTDDVSMSSTMWVEEL